ncbi:hypothetical protein PN4B1_17190 [Paenibacillus naphthalenovorans]|uniref:hypothetical protein n=1 Tax=Paenibacillus naphthalenovorans TaxID=162209 RepID=UPI0010B6BCBF|nr:hypothetical protein [Paenibacillus naphthalenovorans]GCL71814.1 hypothetical protein PN4B1_17190 [Paenibacillus naphthalenovorans]
MNKYIEPKFITGLITMAAITLNNKFGWHLDEVELGASIAVAVNFIVAQITVEIRNGKKPTWNSTKFVTMFVACLLIGFTQYVGIELDTESVLWIAGVAASVINLKWIQDIRKVGEQSGNSYTTESFK